MYKTPMRISRLDAEKVFPLAGNGALSTQSKMCWTEMRRDSFIQCGESVEFSITENIGGQVTKYT